MLTDYIRREVILDRGFIRQTGANSTGILGSDVNWWELVVHRVSADINGLTFHKEPLAQDF